MAVEEKRRGRGRVPGERDVGRSKGMQSEVGNLACMSVPRVLTPVAVLAV